MFVPPTHSALQHRLVEQCLTFSSERSGLTNKNRARVPPLGWGNPWTSAGEASSETGLRRRKYGLLFWPALCLEMMTDNILRRTVRAGEAEGVESNYGEDGDPKGTTTFMMLLLKMNCCKYVNQRDGLLPETYNGN